MISPERKAELIDKYRYDLVEDYHWTRDAQEDFNDFLWTHYAFKSNYISYCLDRGFANFSSSTIDLTVFLKKTSLDKKYPEWIMRGGTLETHCSSRLFNGDIEIVGDEDVVLYEDQEDDAFKVAVARLVYDKTEETYLAMTNDVTSFIRELNAELFGRLQDEYEHLTSDETVWENIVNNEWHLEYEDEQENDNADD